MLIAASLARIAFAASEQMFRVSPDGLTHQQGNELFALLFETAITNKKHERHHPCVECGDSISCSKPGCTESEGECRACREGTQPRDAMWMHKREVLMQ